MTLETSTPISDPANIQTRPRAKHGTAQPPRPPPFDYLQLYDDATNKVPHTRKSPFSLRAIPPEECTRPRMKYRHAVMQDPNPNYGATHPLQRGCGNLGVVLGCVFSMHETPREEQTQAAHPMALIWDGAQQRRKPWCHTPAAAETGWYNKSLLTQGRKWSYHLGKYWVLLANVPIRKEGLFDPSLVEFCFWQEWQYKECYKAQ
ncbi:hypothetical protein BS47DRAFT_1360296 [Hydnum rufescens UP504]|uniref:Uncharacterized protein n=1 Tax=Hydnum rufescens UP504 TaxID=1448309 RepID=A0A9P6B301_9AGAM|nr:hypothetical protein BS47DRAFT_1360296 [Hydnum rufescens UP504]